MSLYSSGFFLTNLLVDSVCRTHKESTLSCHDQCDNLLWWVIWCWWGQPNHVILITSSRKFHMEKLPLGLVHAVFCGQVSRKGIWASWFPSLLSVHFTFNFFILFEKKNYRDKVGDPSGWSHPYELNVVLKSISCHVFHFLPHKQHEHDFIWKIKGQIFF